jgi:hemolysin activation/secretion protein
LLAGAAVAQSSDPAGVVARNNERMAADLAAVGMVPEGEPVVSGDTVRADLPPPGGPTVQLRSVVFDPPSAFLSQAELDAIVANYLGRMVDFSEISRLVRDVNDLYAEKGVVTASALLPPQKLSDGILHVNLVEGRVGTISVVGEHRTANSMLLDAVRLSRDDGVVDVPRASRDILLFNKSHHAQMSLLLQPGAAFGLTDLTLGVVEPRPLAAQVSLDNYGVASTGTLQASASVNSYGAFGIDDNLMLLGTASLGSLAGTVTYDMPVSTFGTRLALGATASTIRVIDGPTVDLDITGRSVSLTGTLSQTLLARSDLTLQGLATASVGASQSFAAGVPLADGILTKLAVGAAATYSNDKVAISVQPQLVRALADNRLDDTLQGFVIATASGNAEYRVTDAVRLVARGAGQYTFPYSGLAGMPGSLLFQIGGQSTVRGYPSDGVAGDSGYYVQTELRWAPEQVEGLDLFLLGDFGQVFSSYPTETTMASVGAGMSYSWNNVTLDASVGIPVIDAVADQGPFGIYARLSGSM